MTVTMIIERGEDTMEKIMGFILSDKGATAPEYVLLAALIAGVLIAVVATLGTSMVNMLQTLRW